MAFVFASLTLTQLIVGARIPRYTPHTLFKLYIAENTSHVARILDYFLCRVIINIEMLDVSELISKNASVLFLYSAWLKTC
jgi:hypothetical protein